MQLVVSAMVHYHGYNICNWLSVQWFIIMAIIYAIGCQCHGSLLWLSYMLLFVIALVHYHGYNICHCLSLHWYIIMAIIYATVCHCK